jgi:phosphatidylserine/phosphatidylglycerophosphate/cardiolipin synthase-like enzyme
MEDTTKGKLTIVIVMPDGADTPKEEFVLGARLRAVRFALSELARQNGHDLRILVSRDESDREHPVTTFVHSKLLIVDDEFLSIGSANLTNRSMEVDMELNLSFQGAAGCELSHDIRSIRASLLAEHAGQGHTDRFARLDTLAAQIDRACGDGEGKLRCHEIVPPKDDDPFLMAVFDPAGAITFDSLERSLDLDDGLFKRTLRKAGQRLGVVDIE